MEAKKDSIRYIVEEGRRLAEAIRNSKKPDDIKALRDQIEKYSDFVCEEIGEPDELDGEKYSELSFLIYEAAETKARHLYYEYEYPENVGNEDLEEFIKMLDFIENNK